MTAEDRGEALRATVREPGAVWCYSGAEGLSDKPPPAQAPFRWLHLNLADQRSLRWLERESGLPPALRGFVTATDATQRLVAAPGGIGLVLQDFEREFDSTGLGEIAPLRVVLAGNLLVTGRRRPVHGADLIRQRLEAGVELADDAAALAFLLGTLVDSFAALVLDLTGDLLETEAELMANENTPDTRELIAARRRGAQLHKLIGNLRTLLQRVDAEPMVPRRLAAVAPALMPRLASLDHDILNAQQQLRLIREELDLETSQRVNQNVYLLSVLTALMAPATLVTGFFGMNTGGMPMTAAPHGTLIAFLIAGLSAGGTYLLLRRMGLIRTR